MIVSPNIPNLGKYTYICLVPQTTIFFMDVWWNNHFLCNDLEASNWNNRKKYWLFGVPGGSYGKYFWFPLFELVKLLSKYFHPETCGRLNPIWRGAFVFKMAGKWQPPRWLLSTRWWQLKQFWAFSPRTLGKWSNSTNVFQMDLFNHQLEIHHHVVAQCPNCLKGTPLSHCGGFGGTKRDSKAEVFEH